ncbi:MAG: type IX secretion system sortase PorU, partial [Saprospiraceae bacterium]|nr:type IX secretion system sortase PorU [Saprospiraceae bacterium]
MKDSTQTIFLILACCLFYSTECFGQKSRSALADGNIYQFSTKQRGIYRLDYAFLEKLGVNPTTIDPKKIQILGAGGGTLPEPNSQPRIDDLVEVSIQVKGEADGTFNKEDVILFYGEGSDKWKYDELSGYFYKEENPYEDLNFYFLKLADQNGKRIILQESPGSAIYQTGAYDTYQHYESDQYNLLYDANDANLQGSGRLWVGDLFKAERVKDFSTSFDFSQALISEPAYVNLQFVARSSQSSKVFLNAGGTELEVSIASSDVTKIETDYAKIRSIKESINLSSTSPKIEIRYPSLGNNNVGWLDYLEFNFRAQLNYLQDQLIITDLQAPEGEPCQYNINNNGSTLRVWEISDPLQVAEIQVFDNTPGTAFRTTHSKLATYIAFAEKHALIPEPVGKVENQDLHGLDDVDYLLIYHPNFKEAANKLVAHRRSLNNFRVEAVAIDQVFNEFSSGKSDPTAIRDFARFLYKKSSTFKYLLLMGDGSFDYRHIYSDINDESFIPVYETERSLHPIEAFPSDDYFALLDDDEGGSWRGALDIAVGRLPVRTLDEANIVVDKIIKYETDQRSFGDWRLKVLFVADDEDGNRHLDSADEIAELTKDKYPVFNVNKVYLDAYEQENTPGGVFNFKAKEALNQSLFKGQLVVNYIGHGGSNGWAQERVLQQEDIDKWNNADRLPLLVTATCSFAGYDDPRKITAGEYTITHPSGGSIALFTTVRAVYARSNERLTRSVFNHIFEPVDGRLRTIGEILVASKNANAADTSGTNARKFTLLGDPALRLAFPEYQAHTTRINGKTIDDPSLDTLNALSKVEIEGEVLDQNGALASTFNGKIYPTIFDKIVTLKTLAQDKGSTERKFDLQKSIIFKGLASVVNGKFKFSFVVPKDINYAFGRGKISYYAESETLLDAGGSSQSIMVGGTKKEGIDDTEGPEIEIYMNDENFVYGGITDRNPVLFLKLQDENGINVIGNSIGHDLTAVINQNLQSSLILNDFYESAQDDYTKGTVSYPLSNLELGTQTITVKAWDIANNSSEAIVEFLVVDEAENGLRHVLNYPNPFSTSTCFQFEHQLQNQDLDIRVEILTPSGRIVQVLEQSVKASGFLSRDIKWDGRDEFGDPLG